MYSYTDESSISTLPTASVALPEEQIVQRLKLTAILVHVPSTTETVPGYSTCCQFVHNFPAGFVFCFKQVNHNGTAVFAYHSPRTMSFGSQSLMVCAINPIFPHQTLSHSPRGVERWLFVCCDGAEGALLLSSPKHTISWH